MPLRSLLGPSLAQTSRLRQWRHLSVPRRTKSTSDVIFSGIQPTGIPHIGNYLGALKQWVKLQEQNSNVIYCIVDLHSITTPQEPETLRQNILDMATCMLASGLDPKKSILFQQSKVREQTQLSWLLSCLTTLPQLSHQPQWRDKSQNLKNPGVGLYTYPILQSADILLYKATSVPVGEDQIKHLELTRLIARTFNKRFGIFFPEPITVLTDTKRIKSLRNPSDKMSKSDENDKSRIELTDSKDEIINKIKKAVTDSLGQLTYEPDQRPGVANLIDIHSGITGQSPEQICKECSDMNMAKYKVHVSEIVAEGLKPIREEFLRLKSEKGFVDDILDQGADKARTIASENLDQIYKLVGLS